MLALNPSIILIKKVRFSISKSAQAHLTPLSDDKLQAAVPDFEKLWKSENQTVSDNFPPLSAEALYLARAHWLSNGFLDKTKLVRIRYVPANERYKQQTRPTADRDECLDDYETDEDLDFMFALQDYLLDGYDQLGLIIETNPSSNVYIARLESHEEHPIFRWYPPDESVLQCGALWNRFGLRRGPIKVTINTDDPGIMPTTLRSEFLVLREAAVALGVTQTTAEAWLERIRLFGIEEFNRNHAPIFS